MRLIRSGVFETNSSSTHSLTICTEEEFEKWKNGEMWYDYDNERLLKKEIKITIDEEASKAKYIASHPKGYFYKTWEDLSDEEIKHWHESYLKSEKAKIESNYDYQTYDQWYYHSDLETFTQKYTSPSGDKLIAFGKFGYN